MDNYILSLDQGTTSSRAIVFDKQGEIISVKQKEFEQIFPQPGWVEHNPREIWSSQAEVALQALKSVGISEKNISAIGITNQRETAVVWDRETGQPVYNAIVWQDRRTSRYCDQLKEQGHAEMIKKKTGLVIDAYFAGTKVKWILDHVDGARQKAKQGKLAFGTIDSWLIWQLTKGDKHITDVSNASRTLLFNIHTLDWDQELLDLLDIPASMLPRVTASSGNLAATSSSIFGTAIIIGGIAGDQQAALFGQQCTRPGLAKSTYGTGSFTLINTGPKARVSKNNLITTIAWQIGDKVNYALEGSIFIAGAVVQWLRDQLGIIKSSREVEALASSVKDNGGVYFVPAFTGLGAPYWDQYARGTIIGMTRGTNKGHLARAALEGIAFQTMDVLAAMQSDAELPLSELRVDGGAAANNLLMQFQADILGTPVVRPKQIETTALGAAYLAGLAVGYWNNIQELQEQWTTDKIFSPDIPDTEAVKLARKWHVALDRSRNWINED
ncbi:MAG: glycerol kinase GlpK [Candidatus Cyclobacteriaceae bacterium M3_2C_046]